MKLHNEFEVSVPIAEVWPALLDIARVAQFLPGAKIEPSDDPDLYNGTMTVKLGPMVVTYRGTARLGAVDADNHSAAIRVQATEARGQGRASATITNRLVDANGRTRVIADTDLQITGRQAQFGRGIMQDVASTMLDDFAKRFEASLTCAPEPVAGAAAETKENGRPAAAPTGAAATAPAPAPGVPEALDIGAVVGRTQAARVAAIAVAALGLLLLLRRIFDPK